MDSYLVFEREEAPEPPMVYQGGQQFQAAPDSAPTLLGYTVVGAVKASDAFSAVQAVMRATRRVGRYAVIKAEFISPADQDNGDVDAPQLNP